MKRRRMTLALAVLFVAGALLVSFGTWLFMITNHTSDYVYEVKPYGTLGFVLTILGVLLLAVTIGLLFDWYHLLIVGRVSRLNRTSMVLILVVSFILGLFLIDFGKSLYEFTYIAYEIAFDWPIKITVQPFWTEGLGLVICGILVLAAVFILLSYWYRLLIHKHT